MCILLFSVEKLYVILQQQQQKKGLIPRENAEDHYIKYPRRQCN